MAGTRDFRDLPVLWATPSPSGFMMASPSLMGPSRWAVTRPGENQGVSIFRSGVTSPSQQRRYGLEEICRIWCCGLLYWHLQTAIILATNQFNCTTRRTEINDMCAWIIRSCLNEKVKSLIISVCYTESCIRTGSNHFKRGANFSKVSNEKLTYLLENW